MISIRTEFLLIFVFCSFINDVESLNYGVLAAKRSSPSLSSSPPSAVSEVPSSTLATNRTIEISPGQKLSITKTPNDNYYLLTFPQGRGGKNLNLTLTTGSDLGRKEQPRILNEQNWYSNAAVSGHHFKKLPAISQIPPLLQENDNRAPSRNKNSSRNPPNLPFTYSTKNYSKVDYFYGPEDLRKSDLPKQVIRNLETSSFTSPQQFRAPEEIPFSIVLQKNYKNGKVRYTFTPQNYHTTSGRDNFPPVREETPQNWPCFCVPYYLCKNGVINSGGRSIAAIRRRTRSVTFDSKNTTQFISSVQPKVMSAYVIEQESDPTQCEDKKVCCRLSFSDDVPDNRDDNYYPVATPRPEPYYPVPPRQRYPDRQNEAETCGIRKALGIHARLRQLQYPADVSEFGEYPWQIAILRKIPGQKSLYICGGVLISPQWITTAAHCIKNEQFSPLLIRLGEWDVNRRDEVYPYIEKEVDFIIIHPDFNPDTLYNDIALIRMKSPVDSRLPHITPVCLPNRETIYEDQKCWVSGWGKDFFGPQGEYQSVLKEVDVPVIMREVCISELRTTNLGPDFDLHPGFLCAGGEPGKDACTGDGGSPLVCLSGRTWYVVGLVSWGLGCGQPGIPGLYINILYYMDWINSIIQG